jgi:hypothetical protein
MKVLIQNRETKEYLTWTGAWTASRDEAMDLCTSTQALEYCNARGLYNMEIILAFEDPNYDMRITGPLAP